MNIPDGQSIELNPDEPLPEWMLQKDAGDFDEERLLDQVIESFQTFSGETIGRTRAADFIEALERNGLKVEQL